MIDEKDLIYAAGFFDGEGNICIKNQTLTNKRKYYRLEVPIANAYFPVINWFEDVFGEDTYIELHKNPIHKPMARWEISSNQAIKFLY